MTLYHSNEYTPIIPRHIHTHILAAHAFPFNSSVKAYSLANIIHSTGFNPQLTVYISLTLSIPTFTLSILICPQLYLHDGLPGLQVE